MKRSILIIGILFCVGFCKGQNDSTVSSGPLSIIIAQSMFVDNMMDYYKHDTVRVFLLVGDTLHYSNYTPTLNPENYFDKAGEVRWVLAYEVRKITFQKKGMRYSDGIASYNQTDQYYYHTEKYLDEFMKPLSKHIIVLSAIPIKQGTR